MLKANLTFGLSCSAIDLVVITLLGFVVGLGLCSSSSFGLLAVLGAATGTAACAWDSGAGAIGHSRRVGSFHNVREGYSGLNGGGGGVCGCASVCVSRNCNSSPSPLVFSILPCACFLSLFSASFCHIFKHLKCCCIPFTCLLFTLFFPNISFSAFLNLSSNLVYWLVLKLPVEGKS